MLIVKILDKLTANAEFWSLFQCSVLFRYTLLFYKQHFYKQHQAEIGKKSSKC